jgi:2-phosphoglycerate kinase
MNQLEIKQEEMEHLLFDFMKEFSYSEYNIQLYKMMISFHHRRIPMIILIAGNRGIGKSTLAMKLSECLNIPSVLKTEVFYDLMKLVLHNQDLIDTEQLWNSDNFYSRWKEQCRIVERGLLEDIKKCEKDGKNFFLEGIHVDSNLLFTVKNILLKGIVIPFYLYRKNEEEDLYNSNKKEFENFIHIEASSINDAVDSMHSLVLEKMKNFNYLE